jgi:hypothetical protein
VTELQPCITPMFMSTKFITLHTAARIVLKKPHPGTAATVHVHISLTVRSSISLRCVLIVRSTARSVLLSVET